MKKDIDKRSKVQEKYNTLLPKYKRLTDNVHKALIQFLKDEGIETLDVEKRVKDFDSLWDKAERKKYANPLEDAEDICGLRIVNYYPSDLDDISELIGKEFTVHEAVDKLDLLDDDRFGYRSYHFIVTLKPEWLKAPPYRGLENIKAEIQVRTILMHAWAAIDHKLSYKKDEDVPSQFKRTLYSLSALIELADNQFDELKKQRVEYRESLVSTEAGGARAFDASQPLTVDSLQSLLDFLWPERRQVPEDAPFLLEELRECDISLEKLNMWAVEFEKYIGDIEADHSKAKSVEANYTQVGAARTILHLTCDRYWKTREGVPDYWAEIVNRWRKRLRSDL